MLLPPPLTPTVRATVVLPSGAKAQLLVCRPVFKKWAGAPTAFDIGKKPLLDVRGSPCFAELAILDLLIASGWQGVWVESAGGGQHLHDIPTDPKHAGHHVAMPPEKGRLLGAIGKAAGTRACFDVFAWKGRDVLFCEAMRRGKDKLSDAQLKFIEGALTKGIRPEALLIAEWTLDGDPSDEVQPQLF